MKKILPLLVVGILVLSGLGVAAVSSDTLRDNQPSDEVESVLQNKEMDSLLSLYGLDIEDTMGEFEQLLYDLASKRRWGHPSLAAELKNDVEELADIMDKIGVTDYMTIAEALPLIENNRELFQEESINLFCSIRVDANPGYTYPYFRLFQVLFGNWETWQGTPYHYVKIKSQIVGLQYCEDYGCRNKSGEFIGLIGFNPPVIFYFPAITNPFGGIRGNFTLFSHSDVPFVESTDGSQQSPCPCNQQGNLQNNNMQSSSQQSTSSSQQTQMLKCFSFRNNI